MLGTGCEELEVWKCRVVMQSDSRGLDLGELRNLSKDGKETAVGGQMFRCMKLSPTGGDYECVGW